MFRAVLNSGFINDYVTFFFGFEFAKVHTFPELTKYFFTNYQN